MTWTMIKMTMLIMATYKSRLSDDDDDDDDDKNDDVYNDNSHL